MSLGGRVAEEQIFDDITTGASQDIRQATAIAKSMITTIDEEVKRIIDECYLKAKAILEEHQSVLEACAQLLLEKEKITRSEFEALFEK